MDQSSFELLRRQTDQLRRNFIDTDIDTAMTFVQLARTEVKVGDQQHASNLLFAARHAHETIARFLDSVTDPEEKQRLTERFQVLGHAIDGVELLQGHPKVKS